MKNTCYENLRELNSNSFITYDGFWQKNEITIWEKCDQIIAQRKNESINTSSNTCHKTKSGQ